MINWFGPASWGAPLCLDAPRCDIPIGVACARCLHPFTEEDCGVTMPGSAGPVAFHLTCNLKSVLNHDQWERYGLIPEITDGEIVDGVWRCRTCGMVYEFASRTWRRGSIDGNRPR